jgi:hypothetical protein
VKERKNRAATTTIEAELLDAFRPPPCELPSAATIGAPTAAMAAAWARLTREDFHAGSLN